MLGKLTEEKYRNEIEGYSQSQLKRFLDVSPREWYFEQQNKPLETPSMVNGTLAHEIALEGLTAFEKLYCVDDWYHAPESIKNEETGERYKTRNGNAYKLYKEKLLENQGSRIYIKNEDLERTKNLATAIGNAWGKDSNQPLLALEGQPEVCLYNLTIAGMKVKGKLDYLPHDKPIICDLKTSAFDLDNRTMRNKLMYEGWAIQAAFYHDLFYEEMGKSRHFVFMVANSKTYQTRTIKVSPNSDIMKYGRRKYMDALASLKECLNKNEWLGYPVFDASLITIHED